VHLTIATAGHIDHGKSALIEAITGTHPDRLPEERARGISIELGFAHTHIGDTTLSFVDVPGHERFVRTMLAGVGGIDAVLLVVAADESVMPQTREHVDICRLLDVPAGVIALTRTDLADDTLQAIAEDEVRALVAGTPLANAEIVRTSARSGAGIDALRAALLRCGQAARRREIDVPARLPIDRVFTVKGFGAVVTGTLWTGRVRQDDVLQLVGASGEARDVRVRGLQVHGAAADEAVAGQRTAVNLAGVSHQEVSRGDVLVGSPAVVVSRRLIADVRVLASAPPQRHGTRVHVHLGTAVAQARLLLGRSADDAAAGTREVAAGAVRRVLLRLESPLATRRGDRLVLRSYSPVTTIGGAVVEDPLPALRRPLTEIDSGHGTPGSWLAARIEDAGPAGVSERDVPPRCGVSPEAAARLVEELITRGFALRIGGALVATSAITRIGERVLTVVDAAAAADPLAGGVSRAALQGLARRHWARGVMEQAIARLVADGTLHGEERLARPRPVATRDLNERRLLDVVDAAGLQGVTLTDLDAQVDGLDRKAIATVLGRLLRSKEVERLGDLHVSAGRLSELTAELRALATGPEAPAALEVGWFKERYGLTRKSAIPLLEWLDRTRVTRRQGDTRVLVVGPGR